MRILHITRGYDRRRTNRLRAYVPTRTERLFAAVNATLLEGYITSNRRAKIRHPLLLHQPDSTTGSSIVLVCRRLHGRVEAWMLTLAAMRAAVVAAWFSVSFQRSRLDYRSL